MKEKLEKRRWLIQNFKIRFPTELETMQIFFHQHVFKRTVCKF